MSSATAPAPQSPPALAQAIQYARLDWHVLPVGQDRRPLGGKGLSHATTDEATLRDWWRRWPTAEVAIACRPSRLVVVDLDVGHTDGVNGRETFAQLCGTEPAGCGLIATTPRGGRHLYYRAPNDVEIRTRTAIRRGIDVRAGGGQHGGYAVAPCGGTDRSWEAGDPFDPGALLPLPSWLLDILTEGALPGREEYLEPSTQQPQQPQQLPAVSAPVPVSVQAATTDDRFAEIASALYAIPASVPRDPWLRAIFATHAAFSAHPSGADLVEAWSATTRRSGQFRPGEAREVYRSAKLPWSEPGTGKPMVDSCSLFALARQYGWRWTRDNSTEIPLSAEAAFAPAAAEQAPPPPFPQHLIEGDDLLSRIVQWIVDTALLPQPALALGNTLPMFGAIVGRRVEGSTGVRTNCLTVGIAGTASGKEHSQKRIVVLLETAGLSAFVGGGWKSGSAIVTSLHSKPSQFVNLDEFGRILLAQAGKSVAPHILDIRKVLLEVSSRADGIYFGDCYANARDNPQLKIREPNLCYYGATVPGSFFKSLQSDSLSDGFLNRHLVFFADEESPEPRLGDHQVRWSKESLVEALRNLESDTRCSELQMLAGLPEMATGCRRVPFADEGSRWRSILVDNQTRMREMRAQRDRCADLWGRFPEHVARLALIKAISRNARAATVSNEDVTWGLELASWCHERMQLAARDNLADNDTEHSTLRLLKIVAEAGSKGITQAALTRQAFWLSARDREGVLKTLTMANRIHMVSQESTRRDGRGRPTTIYFIGPEPEGDQ